MCGCLYGRILALPFKQIFQSDLFDFSQKLRVATDVAFYNVATRQASNIESVISTRLLTSHKFLSISRNVSSIKRCLASMVSLKKKKKTLKLFHLICFSHIFTYRGVHTLLHMWGECKEAKGCLSVCRLAGFYDGCWQLMPWSHAFQFNSIV